MAKSPGPYSICSPYEDGDLLTGLRVDSKGSCEAGSARSSVWMEVQNLGNHRVGRSFIRNSQSGEFIEAELFSMRKWCPAHHHLVGWHVRNTTSRPSARNPTKLPQSRSCGHLVLSGVMIWVR